MRRHLWTTNDQLTLLSEKNKIINYQRGGGVARITFVRDPEKSLGLIFVKAALYCSSSFSMLKAETDALLQAQNIGVLETRQAELGISA